MISGFIFSTGSFVDNCWQFIPASGDVGLIIIFCGFGVIVMMIILWGFDLRVI